MDFNFGLLVALALGVGAAWLVSVTGIVQGRNRTLLSVGLVAILGILLLRTHLRSDTDALLASSADYPVKNPVGGYVSSDECKACHPREYQTWHASFHRTMTQRPSADAVEGAFGVSLSRGEESFELSEDNGQYFVDMPKPDWWHGPAENDRIRRPIALMTGSHNYQVYWVSTGNTAVLAQFPFVYLIPEQMWIPRQSVFMIPPGNVTSPEYGRWNVTCIQCHTTNGRPRLSLNSPDLALSEVAEFGIACEACHGPAGEHVRLMANPVRRYAAHLGITPAAAIVNPRSLPAERSVEVCGQCHSVHGLPEDEFRQFLKTGFRYRPGDELDRRFSVPPIEEARKDSAHFWPDGMYRVTGRELSGVRNSPCFASGKFSCLSCHEPHEQESDPRPLKEWRVNLLRQFPDQNAQCTQCHAPLAESAAVAAHTHHGEASTGSQCVNCHMPHTVYGLGRTARSHQISSPSVQVELDTGRPNACNLCHIEQTLAWTADQLSSWYGVAKPSLTQDQQRIASSLLYLYQGDADQRALAMWAMGWKSARAVGGEDWVVPHLYRALDDPYQVLGLVAWRSLRKIAGLEDLSGRILMMQPTMRTSAATDALAHWPPAKPDTRVLIGADGQIDAEQVTRLLQQRDNRPIVLRE